ncbi:MAG: thiamine phosphate synthase [bacterium]|nr:thiamine phosphate synthase [bacterium]
MALPEKQILRILDANLNRAREGLRVVEEIARFVFDDEALQKMTKSLRHQLASLFAASPRAGQRLPVTEPAAALDREMLIDLGRDAGGDVGKTSSTPREGKRAALSDLIQANFARIEESIRVLEEYTKPVAGGFSPKLKSMRFDIYSLEKDYIRMANRAVKRVALKGIGLYPILDRDAMGGADPIAVARQVLTPGVAMVQYRDKSSSAAEVCRVCDELRRMTSRKGVILIVNDRVDIAHAVGADGVHLGQDDMPVASAREILGSKKIIGKSTHSFPQARRALKEDIDYIAVGPIFSTPTKPGAKPVGCELIVRVRAMTDKPIIAIGGITAKNLPEVLDAGADGAAVISAILKAKQIRTSTRALVNICRRKLKKKV